MKNENEITVKDLTALLEKMKKRLSVSNHSEQTIVKKPIFKFVKSRQLLKPHIC